MKVSIKGAGIIGLSIGWRLAREKIPVEIFDEKQAGFGASWAAAGMLHPFAEAHFEENISIYQSSMDLYPKFLEELSLDAGVSLGFESQGTLIVGIDRSDKSFLERLFLEKQKRKFPIEWLSIEKAKEIEPLLSPRITAAIWLPTESQVDNRRMIRALIAAFQKQGGILRENCPFPQNPQGIVVNAAGAKADPRIRPVKGQIATLEMNNFCRLSIIIRSPRVYLVPKKDQTLRVGATSEEAGFDQAVYSGRVRELLNAAAEIVPAIDEMPFKEMTVGFRPLTEDRLPLIEEREGEILAAGHGRVGILLAPYTANAVYKLIEGKICKSN